MSNYGPSSFSTILMRSLIASASSDFTLQANRGLTQGVSVFHVYSRNPNTAGAVEYIRPGGGILYWPTASSPLIVYSSSSLDSVGQIGATNIVIEGLDANFNELVERVVMSGTNYVLTSGSFTRVNRAYVGNTGIYGRDLSGSNIGSIAIRHSASFEELARIPVEAAGFGSGDSEISNYTVPAGKTAYMTEIHLSNNKDTGQDTSVEYRIWMREGADIFTGSLVQPHKIVSNYNLKGASEWSYAIYRRFPEKTDIWLTSEDGTGTRTNVEYTMILVDN